MRLIPHFWRGILAKGLGYVAQRDAHRRVHHAADQRTVDRATLAFLDVDPSFRPDFPIVNQNRVPRNKLFNRVLHEPPEMLRRLALSVFPDEEKRRSIIRWLRRQNKHYQPRPTIDGALRGRLVAELEPEVRRLGDLIGKDLSQWSRP